MTDENGVGVPESEEIPPATRGRVARFVRSRVGVILLAVVGLVVVIGVVLAIPATRYPLVGLVVKKDARVTVVDSETRKPVSGVVVTDGAAKATTDAKGSRSCAACPSARRPCGSRSSTTATST